jgi:hypothetical protein
MYPGTCMCYCAYLIHNLFTLPPNSRKSMGFELTTLVMICTDCTGSCKVNYDTITTTMAHRKNKRFRLLKVVINTMWLESKYFILPQNKVYMLYYFDISWIISICIILISVFHRIERPRWPIERIKDLDSNHGNYRNLLEIK